MGKLNRIIGLSRWSHRRWGALFGHVAHRWWFRFANRAQAQGQLELAIARFERSLGSRHIPSPQTAYIHRRLAELHRLRHDWPKVVDQCRHWCALEPTCGAAQVQLAQGLIRQNRFEAALQAYGAALALGESVGGAIARIGEQLVAAQRWPLAAAAFALALRGDFTCYGWHRARIAAWFEAADWPEAIAAALALAGSSLPPQQRAEGYYWLGRIEMRRRDWHRAIAANRLALAAGHPSPWTWIHLAEALVKVEQGPEAVRAYRRVIESAAGHQLPRRIYQDAIAAVAALGDWPALAWFCRTAIARFPQETRFDVPLAKALDRLGDGSGAIAAYRRALDHQPGPWLWAQLARLLSRTGDLGGAKAAYETAIAAADPTKEPWINADFYATWAKTWAKKQQWDLAIAALKNAIAQLEATADPAHNQSQNQSQNQTQRGTLLLTLSQWLIRRGDSGDAEDAIAAAIEAAALLPEDATANLRAATLLATAGRWTEAAPLYWHHATGTLPLTLETWHLAIAALTHAQQPAAAIAIARQATLQHPTDPTLPHQLGQLLTQLKRPTDAIAGG
jgi:tetratricopeptide (TPR) repeat protein